MRRCLCQTVFAASLLFSACAQAAPVFINILTGGTSGVYYPIGAGLSQIFSAELSNVRPTVQATRASVENLNLLQAGRGELAFALGDAVEDAFQGAQGAGFPRPLDRLRAVAAIYPNYIHVIANAETGIRELADLKGKRVSVGAPRSGTELNARAIFAAAGLSYADFGRVEYLPYAESAELIKNRQLDATLQSAGLGTAAFRDLATTVPLRFIPIPAEVVTRINRPSYRAGQIPPGTYAGQTDAVPTVTIGNLLVTHSGVPDQLVYQMTQLLFRHLPRLQQSHAAVRDISLTQAAQELPIPLHPGAEHYYRDTDVLP